MTMILKEIFAERILKAKGETDISGIVRSGMFFTNVGKKHLRVRKARRQAINWNKSTETRCPSHLGFVPLVG